MCINTIRICDKEIKTKAAIDKHAKKVAKDGWSSNKILTGSVGSNRRKNK